MKKKPTFSPIKKFLSDNWQPLGAVVVIAIGAVTFYKLPERVEAMEQKHSPIESYIQAIEEQKKLIQKAPPGYQWSEEVQDYVVWRDDPRLKIKK